MEDNKTKYLQPDYSEEDAAENEHPEDDLEDVSEEDIIIEQELDRAANMSDNPFSSGGWSPSVSSNNNNNNSAPWVRNQQQLSTPSFGTSFWGSNNYTQKQQPTQQQVYTSPSQKKVVICDIFGVLYESLSGDGTPDIMPRAIFDIRAKFDVWDKIKSFAPLRLVMLFPPKDIIPSFYGKALEATLEYMAQSISTYLMIPRENCCVFKQMNTDENAKGRMINNVFTNPRINLGGKMKKKDAIYIGLHSGLWGLNSSDRNAAKFGGISYIDVYDLLRGAYDEMDR